MQGEVEVPGGRAVSDKIRSVTRQLPWQVIAGFGNRNSNRWRRTWVKCWFFRLPVGCLSNISSHPPNLTTCSSHLFHSHSQSLTRRHSQLHFYTFTYSLPPHMAPPHIGLIGATQPRPGCGQLPVRGESGLRWPQLKHRRPQLSVTQSGGLTSSKCCQLSKWVKLSIILDQADSGWY